MSATISPITASVPSFPMKDAHDAACKKPTELARASLSAKTDAEPVSETSEYAKGYETFWVLGKDWWKQLYDGKYHQFGPQVFDKGLHDFVKEPGFYEHALKACQWVSEEGVLTARPTIELYQHLHKTACHHFDGKSTVVTSDHVGAFLGFDQMESIFGYRGEKNFCGELVNFFHTSSEFAEIKKKYWEGRKYIEFAYAIESINKSPGSDVGYLSGYFPGLSKEEMLKKLKEASSWHANFQKQFQAKKEKIELHVAQRSKDLGLDKPIVEFDHDGPGTLTVYYKCTTAELHKAIEVLFAEYNKNMAQAISQEEKLRLIADLFQMLEWFHPFPDGQGRTDLILLMKELCRHGFTPAILDEPYASTLCTLDEWVEYLKKGMEKWQKLALQKNSERLYIPV